MTPLRDLIREEKTLIGIANTIGGALVVLVYLWLHDFDLSQPREPECQTVPYAIGDRPSCVLVGEAE